MCNNLLFDAFSATLFSGGEFGAAASNPQAWTCSWGGQLSSSDWPWPRVPYTYSIAYSAQIRELFVQAHYTQSGTAAA